MGVNDSNKYLGFILMFAGSSWAYGSTPQEAAEKAKKVMEEDWKKCIKSYDSCTVMVYKNTPNGWHADIMGIFDNKTRKRLKLVEKIKFGPGIMNR